MPNLICVYIRKPHVHDFKVLIQVSSKTHTSGLPDMHTLAFGCAVLEGECVDIR